MSFLQTFNNSLAQASKHKHRSRQVLYSVQHTEEDTPDNAAGFFLLKIVNCLLVYKQSETHETRFTNFTYLTCATDTKIIDD